MESDIRAIFTRGRSVRPTRSLLAVTVVVAALVLGVGTVSADSYAATQSGDWDDADTWGGTVPVPSNGTDVIAIPSGITVTIPDAATVVLTDGQVVVQGELRVEGSLQLHSATLTNTGDIVISTFAEVETSSQFTNSGHMLVAGSTSSNEALLIVNGVFTNSAAGTVLGGGQLLNDGVVNNHGLIEGAAGGVVKDLRLSNRGILNNYGEARRINVDAFSAEGIAVNRAGGTWSGRVTVRAGTLRNDQGGTVTFTNVMSIAAPATFDNNGLVVHGGPVHNSGVIADRCDGIWEIPEARRSVATYSGNPKEDWCDLTPPLVVAIVSGTLGANGWYTSDVSISWSVTDPETPILSTSDCEPQTITIDIQTTISCSAQSPGGGAGTAILIKRDATPPLASAAPSLLPNGAGWNNTDVTVSFSGSDSMSGVASCDSPASLNSEGTGQSASGVCVDNAGNTSASATVSNINIDKTPPAASASRSPLANANGWNNAGVTVSFNGSDTLSGLLSCDAPMLVAAEGAAQSASGACTDHAGNTSSPATISKINIDLSLPLITFSGNLSVYLLSDEVAIACIASDALSGIESESCPSASGYGYSFDLGDATFLDATATDRAGNVANVSTSFTIQVTQEAAQDVIEDFVQKSTTAAAIQRKLDKLVEARPSQLADRLAAFEDYVLSKVGKNGLTQDEADILFSIVAATFS